MKTTPTRNGVISAPKILERKNLPEEIKMYKAGPITRINSVNNSKFSGLPLINSKAKNPNIETKGR